MRTTSIITVVAVVFALLVVAKSRTVGPNEATGNPVQNTMSIPNTILMSGMPI